MPREGEGLQGKYGASGKRQQPIILTVKILQIKTTNLSSNTYQHNQNNTDSNQHQPKDTLHSLLLEQVLSRTGRNTYLPPFK